MFMWKKRKQSDDAYNETNDDQQQCIGYAHQACQQRHDQGHDE